MWNVWFGPSSYRPHPHQPACSSARTCGHNRYRYLMRFQSRITAPGLPHPIVPCAPGRFLPRRAFYRSIDPTSKRFDDGLPENDRVSENFAKTLCIGLGGTLKSHLNEHLPVVRRVQQCAPCVGNLLDDRLRGTGRSKQSIGRLIGESRKTGLDKPSEAPVRQAMALCW